MTRFFNFNAWKCPVCKNVILRDHEDGPPICCEERTEGGVSRAPLAQECLVARLHKDFTVHHERV